jgi:hypothetical protein
MCIPHGATGAKANGFVKKDRTKKHIEGVSKSEFEKGDPDFIDERIETYKPKKKESFFTSFFEQE